MTREDKSVAIAELKEELGGTPFFYLADSSTLPVAKINKFRRMCFEKGISVKVAKNTLIQKALESEPESKGYAALFEVLHGPTTILISPNPKAPAQLLAEFRKTEERPLLKAAYIDSSIFIGDDQLVALTKLKSKEEMAPVSGAPPCQPNHGYWLENRWHRQDAGGTASIKKQQLQQQ
jgi:large subunit ribosomal protein L10